VQWEDRIKQGLMEEQSRGFSATAPEMRGPKRSSGRKPRGERTFMPR
jgi:hypothetical protein